MLTVINVGEKPILDSELMRHLPLRYGQSVKADDKRISEETKRTRCSRVSIFFNYNYINFILLLMLLIVCTLLFNVIIGTGRFLYIRSFAKMA